MAPQGRFPLRCPTAKFLQRSIRETIVAQEPHEAVIWGLQEMPDILGVRSRLKEASVKYWVGCKKMKMF